MPADAHPSRCPIPWPLCSSMLATSHAAACIGAVIRLTAYRCTPPCDPESGGSLALTLALARPPPPPPPHSTDFSAGRPCLDSGSGPARPVLTAARADLSPAEARLSRRRMQPCLSVFRARRLEIGACEDEETRRRCPGHIRAHAPPVRCSSPAPFEHHHEEGQGKALTVYCTACRSKDRRSTHLRTSLSFNWSPRAQKTQPDDIPCGCMHPATAACNCADRATCMSLISCLVALLPHKTSRLLPMIMSRTYMTAAPLLSMPGQHLLRWIPGTTTEETYIFNISRGLASMPAVPIVDIPLAGELGLSRSIYPCESSSVFQNCNRPGRSMSPGEAVLCHHRLPFCYRGMRLPGLLFSS